MHLANTSSKYLSIIILSIFVVMMMGCSVKKHYKTLSIFFDGVPNPEAQKKEEEKKALSLKERPQPQKTVKMVSQHPAFVERKCNECHNTRAKNFLQMKTRVFCFKCHDRDEFDEAYVHGPVVGGGCLVCHLPHESQYKYLLKVEDSQMCFECHDRRDLVDIEPHRKSEGRKEICTRCHSPHSGDNRFFLVPGVAKTDINKNES